MASSRLFRLPAVAAATLARRQIVSFAKAPSSSSFSAVVSVCASPRMFMVVRSFGAHAAAGAGAKAEPFLDPKAVTDRIVEVIKNMEKVNKTKVTYEARFKEDLDLDSLDAVEAVMSIEEEFGIEIPDSEADKILSIKDAVAYVSCHPMAK